MTKKTTTDPRQLSLPFPADPLQFGRRLVDCGADQPTGDEPSADLAPELVEAMEKERVGLEPAEEIARAESEKQRETPALSLAPSA